ncbi:hypothetical protein WJX74_002244 [Apatococcus lobatus]|uniref:F-box domain-containing protein n=1 Tax=Apatococcus lobatus TaxID=904363 RepID=A0AAW1RS98_9CHLO
MMSDAGEAQRWLDDLDELDDLKTGDGLRANQKDVHEPMSLGTNVPSPVLQQLRSPASIRYGPVMRSCSNDTSGDAANCSNGASVVKPTQPDLAIMAINGSVAPQPAKATSRLTSLRHTSGCSPPSSDKSLQSLEMDRTDEASVARRVSRAGSESSAPRMGGCGLQDLPPEVVMQILDRLGLQARLTAAQSSQWLHSAAMQPHFWPIRSPRTSMSSTADSAQSISSLSPATASAPCQQASLSQQAQLFAKPSDSVNVSSRQAHGTGNSRSAAGAFSASFKLDGSPEQALLAGTAEPSQLSQMEQRNAEPASCHHSAVSAASPLSSSSILGRSFGSVPNSDDAQRRLDTNPARTLQGPRIESNGYHQQQQHNSIEPGIGQADLTGHSQDDWKGQSSLLGCTMDGAHGQRGLTVLVAVVDPVTGQKGYAQQTKAQGLEPRPVGNVGQDVALRSSLLKAGLAMEARESPYGAGWLLAKHVVLAEREGSRFNFLRAAHDQMRILLCKSWDQAPQASALSANLRQLLKKLTKFSWSVTYDAICCSLEHRADCVALNVRTSLAFMDANRGGMGVWREVLQSWNTYRAWALRIVGACGLLAEYVSAEQAAEQMARGLPATPSLFGAARLAFRSQVLLAYGIRRPLQWALRQAQIAHQLRHRSSFHTAHQPPQAGCVPSSHAKQDAGMSAPSPEENAYSGFQSQQAGATSNCIPGETARGTIETFLEVRKLLEELDIADDSTRPKLCHTHGKFRQCFGLEPRPGQLQVKGPLRVPNE